MMYLERYQPQALLTLEDRLNQAQDNILKYISKTQNARNIRAYIKKELNDAFGSFGDEIAKDIDNVANLAWAGAGTIMASGFVTDTIAKEFSKLKSMDDLVRKRLHSKLILGNDIDDLKNQMIFGANNKLKSAILQGIQDKSGIDTIAKGVREVVGNLKRNQAGTVVRTIMLNAIEDAKNEAFDFFKDEIDEWIYWSIMDSRTSTYCFSANGYKTKDRATAKYKPKSHWNCRSTWKPSNDIIRDIDEQSQKRIVSWDRSTVNHRDGSSSTKFKVDEIKYVPRNATRETIFKTWTDSEQKNFLGATRYNLYKSGKADLKELINISRGKLIPIDELVKYI